MPPYNVNEITIPTTATISIDEIEVYLPEITIPTTATSIVEELASISNDLNTNINLTQSERSRLQNAYNDNFELLQSTIGTIKNEIENILSNQMQLPEYKDLINKDQILNILRDKYANEMQIIELLMPKRPGELDQYRIIRDNIIAKVERSIVTNPAYIAIKNMPNEILNAENPQDIVNTLTRIENIVKENTTQDALIANINNEFSTQDIVEIGALAVQMLSSKDYIAQNGFGVTPMIVDFSGKATSVALKIDDGSGALQFVVLDGNNKPKILNSSSEYQSHLGRTLRGYTEDGLVDLTPEAIQVTKILNTDKQNFIEMSILKNSTLIEISTDGLNFGISNVDKDLSIKAIKGNYIFGSATNHVGVTGAFAEVQLDDKQKQYATQLLVLGVTDLGTNGPLSLHSSVAVRADGDKKGNIASAEAIGTLGVNYKPTDTLTLKVKQTWEAGNIAGTVVDALVDNGGDISSLDPKKLALSSIQSSTIIGANINKGGFTAGGEYNLGDNEYKLNMGTEFNVLGTKAQAQCSYVNYNGLDHVQCTAGFDF